MCAHFMYMIVLSIIVIVFITFQGNPTINPSAMGTCQVSPIVHLQSS